MEPTYKIIRFYHDSTHRNHGKIIKRGLTRAEAQNHCQDPATEERGTFTLDDGTTYECAIWFDGFDKDGGAK